MKVVAKTGKRSQIPRKMTVSWPIFLAALVTKTSKSLGVTIPMKSGKPMIGFYLGLKNIGTIKSSNPNIVAFMESFSNL